MSYQSAAMLRVAPVRAFQKKARLTTHHIRRIENAKRMVCGEISHGPLVGLRKDYEKILDLFDEVLQLLVSGYLDTLQDHELKSTLASLQNTAHGIGVILEGSEKIGLEGHSPFPALMSRLRTNKQRLESQIEGILLSLDDSFQDIVSKSALALQNPA